MRGRTALTLAGVMIAGFALSGCSSKAYESDCVFIVGSGVGDRRVVKEIVHPGEKVSDRGDDESFYVPCNARNFLIRPEGGGDRKELAVATTGKGDDATKIGLPVLVKASMYWQLNQNDDVLKSFYPFCRKYECAGRDESGGDNTENNSTPGWNDMLAENHSPAIDQAVSVAALQFGPDLWTNRAEWPAFAEEVSRQWMQQIKVSTGSDRDLFCGTWSDPDGDHKGTCTPVRFTVNDVQPADPNVRSQYEQQITAEQASLNRIADLERRENEVSAQKELAEERAKLFKIPGYREQLAHERRLAELAACGAAQLKVCDSGSGVLIAE